MENNDEMAKWVKQWANASEVFPTNQQNRLEKTGETLTEKVYDKNDICGKYWDMIYEMSRSKADSPDVFKHPIMDKDLAKKAKTLASCPNPVHGDSLGQDNLPKVTQDFTDGKSIRELTTLKNSLYELEAKMGAADGMGEDSAKIQDQIAKVKDDIEELSNLINNPKE